MTNISQFKNTGIKYLFTDIDDTLTTKGQLPADAYQALWALLKAGIQVIPITGRPAGWCDMIARFWPVHSVVGENGAFYFSYQDQKMKRIWAYEDSQRLKHQDQLKKIEREVLEAVPGAAVSADQFCRLFDLAIDFCEDVPALPKSDVDKIVAIFTKHGAVAKVSSIHVNGWFGSHDKLSMCRQFCEAELALDLDKDQSQCVFIGDSPNDEPMFGFFKNSVAVANINKFIDDLKTPPQFICNSEGGAGFVEFTQKLLA